jgi:hypothetical protein
MKKPKQKEEIYTAVICPLCKWMSVGNWEYRGNIDYTEHFMERHAPDPIIKTNEDEETQINKQA